MSTTTNTAPVATTAKKPAKPVFVVNTTERDKATIEDLVTEFGLKSTKEAVELLIEVALSGRIVEVVEHNENGESSIVTVDRMEVAANKINSERASRKLLATREKLAAQIAELDKTLAPSVAAVETEELATA